MDERFLNNYEVIISVLNKILDISYNVLDMCDLAKVNDQKVKNIKTMVEKYEKLRLKILSKEELDSSDEDLLYIAFKRVDGDFEIQIKQLEKAKRELNNMIYTIFPNNRLNKS